MQGGTGERWRRSVRRLVVCGIAAAALAVLLAVVSSAAAATIKVTETSDGLTGSKCSLRAAIQAGDTDTAVAGCAAGSGTDTIDLPAGHYTLTVGPSAIDENSTGDLDISSDLAIRGAGAATTVVDGNATDRVVSIVNGATVSISGVTITGG